MVEAAVSLHRGKIDEMEKAHSAREKEIAERFAAEREEIDRDLERYAREAGITFLEARERLDRLVEAQEEQEARAAEPATGIADGDARPSED
jgi:hypothetical protein